MKPNHFTTKMFVWLFIITMVLSYTALYLSSEYRELSADSSFITAIHNPKKSITPAPVVEVKLLDTKGWNTYTDKTYPISFRYPKGWTVTQSTKVDANGFSDITIKPSDQSPNFHISISTKSFLGLEGLQQESYRLGELRGTSVNGTLIGLKSGDYYYTFDGSMNAKKIAEFKTLMSTVKIQ